MIAAVALFAAAAAYAQTPASQGDVSKAQRMSVCQCVADLLFMAAQQRDTGVPRQDVLKQLSQVGEGDPIFLSTATEATNIAYDMPQISPAKLRQVHIDRCGEKGQMKNMRAKP
ncbi:hypothetical protein [Cupriavidus basilensis]|uniref:Uncharacterized protein n=1 Tax=Cupriavidus basilensis TaxID=68895 RepID=A0A0C4XYD8_9BURK|nr:hypothetical protein [Cupriavidus basilensis]AJG17432.1 hypothetical protein RR42_m0017 [Cupriavidus basilensis]